LTHPLVLQLRFTRAEFQRGLEGLTDEEARRRFMPMNCISWNIGHLAWQEQRYFLFFGQGQLPFPEIDEQFAYRAPASTPALDDVRSAWQAITLAADPWLDTLTSKKLQGHVIRDGQPTRYIFGSLLQRVIYHYWYHTGEIAAIRQNLGHADLPQFVGDIDSEAPYRPE
jgi:uncharacterized damage-inducible protein DinB